MIPILYRLPEIHGVFWISILVLSALFVPLAETNGPLEVTSCGWHGWVGWPVIVCPGDSWSETLFVGLANIGNYPLASGLLLIVGPTRMFDHWQTALGLVQLILLLALLWRIARYGGRFVRGAVSKKPRP